MPVFTYAPSYADCGTWNIARPHTSADREFLRWAQEEFQECSIRFGRSGCAVVSYRPSLYEFHKIADDILRCKTEGRRYFCNITTICGHSWILESDTCTLRHSVFNFILRCFIIRGSRNWKHHWKVQKNSRFLDKVVKSIDTQWQYYYFKMSV